MSAILQQWLDRKLKVGVYELRGDEIIQRGWPTQRPIRLGDMRTWQSFLIGGGVMSVCIEFTDGKKVDYEDKYSELFRILRETAPERELEFFTE